MILLAAIPLFVLLRRRLVAPTALLAGFVLLDVRSEFTAGADGAHLLYFGGWFLLLMAILAAAAVEYGVRTVYESRFGY